MFFRDVVGQPGLTKRLTASVHEGRVSHALLFTGPQGTGKLALALAYAQFVNCLDPGTDDSCGSCGACLRNTRLMHPDLHFVFPVNTSKDVKKEPSSDDYLPVWREQVLSSPYFTLNDWYEKIGIENKQGIITERDSQAVMRKLSLVAYEGKYRIMLIWQAEKMNTVAANKLLKILEEPPDNTLFLITTNNPEDLLPTIVSRTQHVAVPPVPDEAVSEALQHSFGLPADRATLLASLASGNYSHARELAEGTGTDDDFTTHFILWMRTCFTVKMDEILHWVEQTASLGREKQKAFLTYGLHIVRESLNMHFGDKMLKRMTPDEDDFMQKFHLFINGNTGPAFAEIFNEAIYHIERNANPKILFLDLSLKVTMLLKSKN